MKGRKCKIIASAKMNSILIQFENGQQECVSRHSVRKLLTPTPPEQLTLFKNQVSTTT